MCTQSEPVNVIVVVHTAPTHFLQRENIRETYGARKLFLPTEVRVIFLLGRVEDLNLQRGIVDEHNKYGDIIQGDFKDAYHNLTYKAVMGLHWVSHYCPDVEYVIKTDDDVMFDMWRFIKQVYANILFISRTIYGIARFNDCIPRSGKWTVPSNFLRGYSYYPFQFCIGFVLIISADVIPDLYFASFKVPFFWLDDVYLTGLLRSAAGGIPFVPKA
ncbi:UDP-GalNAc:beta-1,3-N-acetylgalactosaminyltransferase 1-like [Patella vulgata]|uniref:UDP-GalNAc:beta-1, 3-N-acetylgalactosaminyltransferase 1-like n=1 Tax=Patella vulgata TaxID=6465 RepID=UPI0021807C18|nr:UDP-GalNAc:beta-1,3-N-acetylgalactosaminyltransferase 1-like [Patella vulgata]